MSNYRLIFIVVILINLLLYRCTHSPVEVTGGASGTDVSACMIKGVVFDSLDRPLEQALIRLRPQHYLSSLANAESDTILETIVDARSSLIGTFHIDSVVPGYYMLEATLCKDGFLCPITVGKEDTLIVLPPCILRGMSEISGKIPLPPAVLRENNVHLEVYGTEFGAEVDTSGIFTMVVPGGDYWIRVYSSQSDTTEFDFPVKTRPGEHLDVGVVDIRRDRIDGGPPGRRVPSSVSRP